MLRRIWHTTNRTEFSIIECNSRWSHRLDYVFNHTERHRWNASELQRSRQQPNRLMKQNRSRNEQRRLYFITIDALNQLWREFVRDSSGIRNETGKTPEHRVQLPDNPVLFKFQQTRHRNLRINVLLNRRRVV